jgi:hypothetical protein
VNPSPLSGPEFSSYGADDVQWLVTDLSSEALELPIASREPDIQSGRMHYSETLPIEYLPSDEYLSEYARSLVESASTIATAVGELASSIIASRGNDVTIVSLARAGVPVGVLLRRWAVAYAGIRPPHFAISIIRDRGIDEEALDYLLARVAPSTIQFVDGWTGKGAIADTLRQSIIEYGERRGLGKFDLPSSGLAVLSDPLGVAEHAATRADILIPSACLNATVSGLVSRTVYNPELIRQGMFHGAKFYRELASDDRSAEFIDTIEREFNAQGTGDRTLIVSAANGADPQQVIRRLMARYGVIDRNRIKPGIGECTRVLLRRVPGLVVCRSDANRELAHLRILAKDRGVPIVFDDDMPFQCLGVVGDAG